MSKQITPQDFNIELAKIKEAASFIQKNRIGITSYNALILKQHLDKYIDLLKNLSLYELTSTQETLWNECYDELGLSKKEIERISTRADRALKTSKELRLETERLHDLYSAFSIKKSEDPAPDQENSLIDQINALFPIKKDKVIKDALHIKRALDKIKDYYLTEEDNLLNAINQEIDLYLHLSLPQSNIDKLWRRCRKTLTELTKKINYYPKTAAYAQDYSAEVAELSAYITIQEQLSRQIVALHAQLSATLARYIESKPADPSLLKIYTQNKEELEDEIAKLPEPQRRRYQEQLRELSRRLEQHKDELARQDAVAEETARRVAEETRKRAEEEHHRKTSEIDRLLNETHQAVVLYTLASQEDMERLKTSCNAQLTALKGHIEHLFPEDASTVTPYLESVTKLSILIDTHEKAVLKLHQEITTLHTQLSEHLARYIASTPADSHLLEQCTQFEEQLGHKIHSLPAFQKSIYQEQLRKLREQLEQHQAKLAKQAAAEELSRKKGAIDSLLIDARQSVDAYIQAPQDKMPPLMIDCKRKLDRLRMLVAELSSEDASVAPYLAEITGLSNRINTHEQEVLRLHEEISRLQTKLATTLTQYIQSTPADLSLLATYNREKVLLDTEIAKLPLSHQSSYQRSLRELSIRLEQYEAELARQTAAEEASRKAVEELNRKKSGIEKLLAEVREEVETYIHASRENMGSLKNQCDTKLMDLKVLIEQLFSGGDASAATTYLTEVDRLLNLIKTHEQKVSQLHEEISRLYIQLSTTLTRYIDGNLTDSGLLATYTQEKELLEAEIAKLPLSHQSSYQIRLEQLAKNLAQQQIELAKQESRKRRAEELSKKRAEIDTLLDDLRQAVHAYTQALQDEMPALMTDCKFKLSKLGALVGTLSREEEYTGRYLAELAELSERITSHKQEIPRLNAHITGLCAKLSETFTRYIESIPADLNLLAEYTQDKERLNGEILKLPASQRIHYQQRLDELSERLEQHQTKLAKQLKNHETRKQIEATISIALSTIKVDFDKWLIELEEFNKKIKIKTTPTAPDYNKNYLKLQKAGDELYEELQSAGEHFFESEDLSKSNLQQKYIDFCNRCTSAIAIAQDEFKNHRDLWFQLPLIFRMFIGVLMAIPTAIGSVFGAEFKHGYQKTFFDTPKTNSEITLDKLQQKLQEMENEIKGVFNITPSDEDSLTHTP